MATDTPATGSSPTKKVDKLAGLKKAKLEAEVAKTKHEVKLLEIQADNEALDRETWRRQRDAEAATAEYVRDVAREDAKQAALNTKAGEIQIASQVRAEGEVLASNTHNFVYSFDTDVSEGTTKKCISQLIQWSRKNPGCDITLEINSPGGDIVAGFALIDFIRALREQGHHVTTSALGMAASMGAVLLQAGDTRVMGRHAVMLIHEASFGAVGSYGEVEDRMKLVDIFHDHILDIFAERAKIKRETIVKNWQRKDWWLDSATALKSGFIDEIR